jgi:hypothetical protein
MPFTHNPKPNFLTCPGVPELEQGKSRVTSHESRVGQNLNTRKISKEKGKEKPPSSSNQTIKQSNNPPPAKALPSLASHLSVAKAPRIAPAKKKIHWIRWSVIAGVLILLALTVPAGIALGRAASAGYAAKAAVGRIQTAFQARDFDAADTALAEASADLATAHTALGGVGFWRNAPFVGNRIRALEDATEAGRETLDSVEPLIGLARDIMGIANGTGSLTGELSVDVAPNRSFAELAPDEKRAILARISRSIPEIKSAQAKVDIALDRWNAIPQNDLIAPLRLALQPVAEGLPKLKRSLDEAVPLMEVALPLAGYPSPSNYLVLLQNSDEIRATGGFIGTVGKLEVDGGNITGFSFDDVYNIDNPASGKWTEQGPAFMTTRMNMPKLFLRDANYTPDFPVSAERVMDFYVREVAAGTGKAPPAPTGVIALNPPVFADLLRITGPITVDNYTFTADNYFDILEYQVEVGFLEKGIPRNQRKDLVSKLGDELMKRMTSLPASKWPEFLDVFTGALDKKQIQIYARDPSFLAQLDELGWTGRTKAASDDYLWVVDTNLVSLKTDGVMEKKIAYAVDASDPKNVTATVTLRYSNHADRHKDFKYSRYRDYVRVYVPEGATFISADGAMADDPSKTGGVIQPGRVDVTKELGKTAFGAFWSIDVGETREMTFRYTLPSTVGDQIAAGKYQLDWQKQSGNDSAALALDVALGKKLKTAVPPEEKTEWGDTNYRANATSVTDQGFSVTF